MKWYERYAGYHGFNINRNVENQVVECLTFNQTHSGELYCPKKEHTADNICPCKELRENFKCSCNFFVKKE